MSGIEAAFAEPGLEGLAIHTSAGIFQADFRSGSAAHPALIGLEPHGYSVCAGILSRIGEPFAVLHLVPPDESAFVTGYMLAAMLLSQRAHKRFVLAGFEDAGSSAIRAARLLPGAAGVIAIAAPSGAEDAAQELSPLPLLLLHGEADPVVPFHSSLALYHRAAFPKQIRTYPGCLHELEECRLQAGKDVLGWLREHFPSSALPSHPSAKAS